MDEMDNEKKPYSRAGRKVLIPLKPPKRKQRKAIKEHAWMFGCPHAQSSVPGGGDSRLNDRARKSLSLQQWWCRVKDVAPLLEQAKKPSQENTKPGETRHLQSIHECQAGGLQTHVFVRLHVCNFATPTSTSWSVQRSSHHPDPN
jgi:hypothetical protein